MTATSTLADRGVAIFETELELLVDQYRGTPTCLPPQRIAEVFGRYFALECLRAYGVNGFQYASQGLWPSSRRFGRCPRIRLLARSRPCRPPIPSI
jgi:hypothetical protein